jgi:dihydropteroate synthase|uniref:dihydropteroate synthase n=1 Tax=candidate division WOR-3 bacterium TaxID=2052148 RepID=A0A7C6EHA7_UNCW3
MELLFNLRNDQLLKELKEIGVASEAYPIFLKKSEYQIIKIEKLSPAQANILKQIALICGGDVAIPKDAYFGSKRKRFNVLLFANLREIEKMITRLQEQPWMEQIKNQLSEIIKFVEKPILKIGNEEIRFERTYIMGIINISPDSFYSGSRYTTISTIKKVIAEMEREGADFIDIGAESTRPGAKMLEEKEEIERLKSVLPIAVKFSRIPVSVDTYKAEVAKYALDQGVRIINDISGLGFHRPSKKLARVIGQYKACVVIMHIQGTPKTMQINPQYKNLLSEIKIYLKERIDFALQNGIDVNRIIIDPGLGFGKRLEDNYEIIERLAELKIFRRPILVGHSRKSFIGNPFNLPPEERLEGTLAVEALLIKNGASIIRVHDVLEAKKVALLIDKITK